MFDWDAKVYWNRTENDQIKTYHTSTTAGAASAAGMPGNKVSGCIGEHRGYLLDTVGVDVNNTSRFEFGDWRNAITYGLDAFQDDVVTSDLRGNSNITTPGGMRTVSGGFVQWKENYCTCSRRSARFATTITSWTRQHVSPAATACRRRSPSALTPVAVLTPYVSYAEGYRAPSITETLIAGACRATGGDSFFRCPSGTPGPGADSTFCFLPNPNLRPEVGKNKEIGLNLKYNDIFTSGDSFRGKFNLFRNDVDDYIDLVASARRSRFRRAARSRSSSSIRTSRMPGSRVSKPRRCMMPACWYRRCLRLLSAWQERATNIGLYSIPPQKITTTAGVRLLDRTLVLSVLWTSAVAIGLRLLWLAAGYQFFDGLNLGSSMCLRGAGDVRVPALLVLPVSLLLFVPLAHAFTFAPGQGWVSFLPQFGWGAVGGWIAVLIYVMVLGTTLFLRWRSRAWQKIRL